MNIKQIRNATIVVEYADNKFLIDPVLGDKGAFPPFPNSMRQDQPNPLVSLPISIDEIINVDAVIVTHLHKDHFDDAAKEVLPKNIKIFAQDEEDSLKLREAGFENVEILKENTQFKNVELNKTPGQHGRGEVLKRMGNVSGIVFKHSTEKTLYVAGDTVWYEGVQEVIDTYKPEIIVVNGGDNQLFGMGSLVMGKADIYEVHKAATDSTIISSHMEAMNHWTLSREELRNFIKEKHIADKVLVPKDGEEYVF
jgi:L-ascorbate metabolism protein UlaG (beta-lactamase superfamily)